MLKRAPTSFEMKVYKICSLVPKGKVSTYKKIARKLGINSPRAVGQALKRNPFAPHCPCHRVVSSDGSIGGFGGKTGGRKIREKIRILKKEGVEVQGNKILNFEEVLCKF